MSFEPATSHLVYRKDNLDQACKHICEAHILISESPPFGSWLVLRLLSFCAWWCRGKSDDIKI